MQYVFVAVTSPEKHSLNQTLALIVVLIVSIVIMLAKKQLNERYIYLLIVFSAAMNVFDVFGAQAELKATDDPDEIFVLLEYWCFIILVNFCLCSFFTSPSIRFLIFGYVPTFALALVYLIFKYGDFEDSEFVSFAASLPVYGLIIVGIFYVLQYRELLRYFELKQSE